MALPGLNQEEIIANLPTRTYEEVAAAASDESLATGGATGTWTEDEDYGPFSAGKDQLDSLGFRFVQMTGDLWDIKSWEETGREGAERNEALVAQYKRKTLAESEGMGDIRKWINDTVKTQIVVMGPSILAGTVAGFVATFFAPATAAGAAIVSGAGLLGAFVPNYVLNTGEAYAKQIQASGNIDAGVAAYTGFFAAILDTIIPGKISGRIVGNRSFRRHLAKKLADGSRLGNQFKQGIKFMLAEGFTETTQELMMQMARDWVNDIEYQFSDQDKKDLLESFAAGSLMGKFFGVVTPAGTGRARVQVKAADEFKAAQDEAISNVQVDRDAAIEAITTREKTSRAEVNAAEDEIRALKKEARNKIRSLSGTESIADIEKIVPPIIEEEIVDEAVAPEAAPEAAPAAPAAEVPPTPTPTIPTDVIPPTVPTPTTPTTAEVEISAIDTEITSVRDQIRNERSSDRRRPLMKKYYALQKKKRALEEALPPEVAKTRAERKRAAIEKDILDEKKRTAAEGRPEGMSLHEWDEVKRNRGVEGAPAVKDFDTIIDDEIAVQETKVADAEAALATEGATIIAGVQVPTTLSKFNRRRIISQAREKVKEEKAELQRLEAMKASPEGVTYGDVARQREAPIELPKAGIGIPAGVTGVEAGIAPTAEAIQRRIFERDRAAQEARALSEAAEQNRLAADARRKEAADEAAAKARAEAEDAAAARADREEASRADAAARRKEMDPVLIVEELGASELTHGDIAVITPAIRSAWNLRRDMARDSRIKARAQAREDTARTAEETQRVRLDKERAAQAVTKADERAAVETERKRKVDEAKAQTEFEQRETDKTIEEAEASASETIAEFEERPLTITEMRTMARVRGNTIGDVDRIGSSQAKKAYLEIVRPAINEIERTRIEEAAKKAEVARAAPAAAAPAKPAAEPVTETFDAEIGEGEIVALETLIAEQEVIIDTMVKAGITTDKADPKPFSIPELQQQMKEKAANEVILGRLREKAEAAPKPTVKPTVTKKKTKKKAAPKPTVVPTPKPKTVSETDAEAAVIPLTEETGVVTEEDLAKARAAVADAKKPKPTPGEAAGPTVVEPTGEPQERADVAPIIRNPREAVDAVIDGTEPDVAIEILAEEMDVTATEAEVAFNEEMTKEDAQAMVEAAEERGAVAAGTTAAMKEEAAKVAGPKKVVTARPAVGPDKGAPPSRKRKVTEDEIRTTYKGFRINRAGTAWTAKIANSPAKITIDEVGEYHTQYKGVTDPTPYTSLDAAKISLLDAHGTSTEKQKIPGRKPEVKKAGVVEVEKPDKKQKYSSEEMNFKDIPVQIRYEPDGNKEKPHFVYVDGKPFRRYADRKRARFVSNNVTREDVEKELLKIQKTRLKGAETTARGVARVEAAIARAPEVAIGTVHSPPRATLAGLPLPTLNDKRGINNPNVRIDADVESNLVKDVVGEEGNPITVSYEKRDIGVAEDAKRKSFRESEVSGTRFWTFTPFFPKSKEEAQAISSSIYANADRFRSFMANEISIRSNPNSISMGVISDDEAFQMQQSYQRRVDKLLQSETRTKRLTPADKAKIEGWRAKIKELNTNEGRNRKATIIPGTTMADFDESLTRWVDMLEDQGQDVSALKGALSLYTKKKVDEALVDVSLPTTAAFVETDINARRDIVTFFEQVATDYDSVTDKDIESIWDIYSEDQMIELGDRTIPASQYILELSLESGLSDIITQESMEAPTPPTLTLVPTVEESADELEARLAEKVPKDGIETLRTALDEGAAQLTVSHIGATELVGETDDALRILDMKDDLGKRLDEGGFTGFPSSKLAETQISLAEGENFLEGAGHGADIFVLHRIPNERTAQTGEEFTGPIAEDHTLENWRGAILDSQPSLVYIWGEGGRGDFTGFDFSTLPGYELVGKIQQEGEMGSGQFTLLKRKAELELDEYAEIQSRIDPTFDETIDEEVAIDVSENVIRISDRPVVEEGEMTDEEFDKSFGYTVADEESALDEQYKKEREERGKQKTDEKTSIDFILESENPAELHSKLSEPPAVGGYSVAEVRSLAANIKAVNPDFEYNPKAKKADITASIMEWYTTPMEDAYVEGDLIETEENDDVVESRRLREVTTFHSPRQAEQVIRAQFRGIFGKKAVNRFEEIKFINFVDSATAKEMGASETAQAFVSRGTGQIYFISDKIPSDMGAKEMRGLIFHEMGVHFGRDVFSGTEWDSVLLEVYRLSKSGDDIVNAAVARVMRGYNYKEFDSGIPVIGDTPRQRHSIKSRRHFWEEVLAHVVEVKQPVLDAPARKGLVQKIRDAFKTFFTKISKALGGTFTDKTTGERVEIPNVTLDDVVNLIGYSTWHSGIQALERHGDSKPMSKLRDRKRKEFLKGSKMQEPVFHGTPNDWSSPLIERTQLGLHVGTSIAAVNIAKARHFKNTPPIEELDDVQQELDSYIDIPPSGVVKAWKPGWEKQISNRDLEDISISWDPALALKRASFLEGDQWNVLFGDKEAAFTVFNKGTQILRGYINIQDSLLVDDLGNFSDSTNWLTFANKKVRGLTFEDEERAMWVEISEMSTGHARSRVRAHNENDIREVWSIDEQFSKELRALIKKNGYDSLEYINDAEDIGSTSWVLFDDNQFKSVYDLSFDSGTSIFATKKVIKQSNSSEIVESRRVAREATKEVVYSRLGEAKARSFIKGIQRAIEPLMAVEGYDQLETTRMLTKGKVGEWANTGRIIFDILNEATPTEKKAIYKYFTTRNADPSKLPDRRVRFAEQRTILRGTRPGDTRVTKDESIRAKVVETKKLIASLGDDLVKTGLITQEQYNEWKNQYLPRVYMEHVMGGKDRIGLGGLRTSSLTYTKHRKDHENFLNDVISGRIDDPGFLASRYVTMAGSDMAIIKYLDFIASDPGNNNWVLPGQIMVFKGMTGTSDYFKSLANDINHRANLGDKVSPERAKQMRELAMDMNAVADKVTPDLRGVNLKRYRKVPDSPRYGAMRGLYVQKDIWNDINGLGITADPSWAFILKWSGRVQTTFKYTKVPMNIPTQVRNIISNSILMNVSGTNFFRLPGAISKAMHDVVSNGKYMQLARKYGLETTTFAATELGAIDRELAKVKSSADSFDGMWQRSKIFFNDYLDVGGRAYQKTEILFKVAKMIDLMENHGKTEAEAVKLANEALLDYGNVSQAVRLLRTMPLGSPFITFNVKALAQMARNVKQHPFASLKYAAIPYLFMEMFLSQNDDLDEDDWDALMEFLPDYMETEFSTMVFPYKNEQGKWQAWDVSFFLPWGAHLHLAKNIAKGEFGKAVYGNVGMFGGPAQIPLAISANEDPFTKQPIYNEFDPPMQRYEDLMMFVASYMMPPMLIPRNRAGDIVRGGGPLIKTMMAANFIDGNVGADGLPRYTMPNALLSWGGVSVQQLSGVNVARSLYFKQRELDKIQSRMQEMMSDPGISQEKRERLMNEYREHWLKTVEEHRKWAEHLKRVQRLFE